VTHISKANVLSKFSSLTYSVAETGKALFKITLGFVYYQKPTCVLNVFGTFCALAGIFMYSKAKIANKLKTQ